jgi:hypothetical protein
MEAQDFINALFPRTVAATQQGGGFAKALAGKYLRQYANAQQEAQK